MVWLEKDWCGIVLSPIDMNMVSIILPGGISCNPDQEFKKVWRKLLHHRQK